MGFMQINVKPVKTLSGRCERATRDADKQVACELLKIGVKCFGHKAPGCQSVEAKIACGRKFSRKL